MTDSRKIVSATPKLPDGDDWSTSEEEESILCTLPDTKKVAQVRMTETVQSALENLSVPWNDLTREVVQSAVNDMLLRVHQGRHISPYPCPFDSIVADIISLNRLEPANAQTPSGEAIPKGSLSSRVDAASGAFFTALSKVGTTSKDVMHDVTQSLFTLESILLLALVSESPAQLTASVTTVLAEVDKARPSGSIPAIVHQFFRYILLLHANCERTGASVHAVGPHKMYPIDVYLILKHNALSTLSPNESVLMSRLWLLDTAIETYILDTYRVAKRRLRLSGISGSSRVINAAPSVISKATGSGLGSGSGSGSGR